MRKSATDKIWNISHPIFHIYMLRLSAFWLIPHPLTRSGVAAGAVQCGIELATGMATGMWSGDVMSRLKTVSKRVFEMSRDLGPNVSSHQVKYANM